MRTGTADLPLHYGKCPGWLFSKMKKLSGAISEIIINEYGTQEFLRRLSEPWWFQSFGCVLGFDWHSSGLTTTVCGALKEALRQQYIGVYCAGGKGKTSRKTPYEIKTQAESINLNDRKTAELVKASRLAAKVDNSAVQDGYQLYHHSFFFDEHGKWAVIQQGMPQIQFSNCNDYARRYHWLSDNLNEESQEKFVCEPHTAICCDKHNSKTLNMTAKEAKEARKISVDLIKENPAKLENFFKKNAARNNHNDQSHLNEFSDFNTDNRINSFMLSKEHFPKIYFKMKLLMKAYEQQPQNYQELLLIKGVGPKTIRALALLSELIYGTELSWKDPCKFSFAHGGKDGWPYLINKQHYDKSIQILKDAIEQAKLNRKEKLKAFKRLSC